MYNIYNTYTFLCIRTDICMYIENYPRARARFVGMNVIFILRNIEAFK